MAHVTAAFSALVILLLTMLAMNTTRLRFRPGASGDPQKKEGIRRASRAHGNLLEHAVPVLLLMFFYEMNGGSIQALCSIGTIFLLARLSHAYGILTRPASVPMQVGAATTYIIELALIGLLASRLI